MKSKSFLLIILFIFSINILQANEAKIAEMKQLLHKYEISNNWDTSAASILIKLYNESRLSSPYEALKYVKKAQEIYEACGNKSLVARTYNLTGNIYFSQELYNIALENYFKCYLMEEELKESGAIGYSLNDIANTYYAQKIYDIPLIYYKKAVSIFIDRGDKFGLAVSYNNIALVKRNTGQYDSSLFYLNKALDIRKTLNSPYLIAHSYNYITEIYLLKNEFSKAVDYAKKSIDIIEKINNKRDEDKCIEGDAYSNLGDIYLKQHIFNLALKNYNLSLSIYQSLNEKLEETKTYININYCFFEQNEYTEASDNLLNALKIASENKYLHEKRKCFFLLYKLNEKNNNTNSALNFLKQYSALSDSLEDKKFAQKLNEVHIAIETFNKEKENTELRNKNLSVQRMSLAIIYLLSMVVLFAIYYMYTRKKSEKRWHQLSNATFEGIIIHDNSVIIDGNNKLEDILGCKRRDFIGKYIFDFIPQPQSQDVLLNEPEEHVANYETKIIRPDKSEIYVEILSRPFEYKGKAVRVASLNDISLRKDAEKKLKEYADNLKELNATKNKFFSIISHDLRNYFSNIIGFSDILLNELKINKTDNFYDCAFFINESSKKAYLLLENLLEWSLSQTGKLIFNPTNINVNKLVKHEIELLEIYAKQKNITITINSESLVQSAPNSELRTPNSKLPTIDCFAYADMNLVKTVLRNLISNAIKFTDKDGKVNVSVDKIVHYIRVCVSDTGKGMTSDEIANLLILTPNSKLGTLGEKGIGLGLILCKEFVEKNAGKIWVESLPGKGSKFYFTLPKSRLN